MTGAATAIATLGPVGRWPLGPGTLASALVAPLWIFPAPFWAWPAALAAVTLLGVWAAGRAETVLGHDAGSIVIDEVAGMGIALLAAPRAWAPIGIAFLLFRFFDIVKPPPLGRLQEVPGGWGVLLDDVAAGAAAAAALALGRAAL